MPINPNISFAELTLCIILSKMSQQFLDLVKTAIFNETLDRVKQKLGVVKSNQDIGNRSQEEIIGIDLEGE